MISKPFDFHKYPARNFKTPKWFQHYVPQTEESLRYWKEQYKLAKAGKPHRVPEWSMRSSDNELHQRMAGEFWNEVPKDFSSILDVGCSDGYMVRAFQEAGKQAAGVNDFIISADWAYIEQHRLAVKQADMHDLPYRNGSFDAVWCRHTLEHSFAPLQVLAEINRVLKLRGYLFIVLPPPPNPPEPFEDHWHQIPDYQLRYLLECCQFEVLRLWTAYFSFKSENDNLEIRAIARKIGGW